MNTGELYVPDMANRTQTSNQLRAWYAFKLRDRANKNTNTIKLHVNESSVEINRVL